MSTIHKTSTRKKYAAIPQAMRAVPRWGVWRSVPQGEGKKPKKIAEPYPNQPSLWTRFESAVEKLEHNPHYAGPSFYLGDGYAGADLDGVRDPESGKLTPFAKRIIIILNTYAEVSPSKTGVKLYMRGRLPDGAMTKIKLDDGTSIELYDHGRFFAVTGEVLPRSRFATKNRTRQIAEVYRLAQEHAKTPVATASNSSRRTGAEWSAMLAEYGPTNHDNLTIAVMGKLRAHGIEPELVEALLVGFDHWSECVLGRRAFGEKEIRRKLASVERMHQAGGRPWSREIRRSKKPAAAWRREGRWTIHQ